MINYYLSLRGHGKKVSLAEEKMKSCLRKKKRKELLTGSTEDDKIDLVAVRERHRLKGRKTKRSLKTEERMNDLFNS
ncbi:hypothetical protein SAMN05444487_1131 [Marininema mesophilum]|uniref:Uncharacterized protein n=1 Tax=Marininema mesophilum TaxID=1048340 RepID=A0A1H3A945_9BACL|nr:hypothetical protein [Marininema mesophilum]SDX26237.1 hypothetical protein SAMN05444487_1131 [Marininema mesophilum]